MENKKNKKKLFAIIGASALAFILTVALSVSITLAYFGGKANGTQTVTLDKAVTVDYSTTATAQVKNALPGQKVDMNAKATVASGESGAFVAMKVTVEAGKGTGTGTLVAPTLTFDKDGTWTKVGDYYYYTEAAGTAEDKTAAMKQVANAAAAELKASFIVDTTLDNTYAESTITINVDIIAVQGVAFDASGAKIAAPTIANVLEMFKQFDSTIVTA